MLSLKTPISGPRIPCSNSCPISLKLAPAPVRPNSRGVNLKQNGASHSILLSVTKSIYVPSMTIVTALYDGQKTWLGHNDSATVGDTVIPSVLTPWLFVGEWALGITGESAQQTLLECHRDRLAEAGTEAHKVVCAMQEVFSDFGHTTQDDDDASPSYKIWCILAHKNGQIWDVDARLALTPIPPNKLWARGSGTDYALGADQILAGMQVTSEERIYRATAAAIACDVYCPGQAKAIHLQQSF